MNRKPYVLIIVSFFLPLLIIASLYFILPSEAISLTEKRELQQLPELRFDDLVSGVYAESWDAYYRDQLPAREFFIRADQAVNQQLNTLFGLNELQLVNRPGAGADLGEGENLGTDGKEIVTFPTTKPSVSEPSTTSSNDEAAASSSTEESTTSGSETDSTTESLATSENTSETSNAVATPTPQPQPSESETAATTETTVPPTTSSTQEEEVPVSQTGGILVLSDRAVEIFYSSQTIIDSYLNLIDTVERESAGARVFSLIAPTASEFYAPSAYRQGSSNQKDVIANIYAAMPDAVRTVDAYSKIAPHQSEYLYFRTDHHWTGLGAYYAYTAMAEAAGFEALSLSEMQHGSIEGDFLGTLYAWTNQAANLAKHPDFVEYWMPPVTAEGYAFTDASMTAGYAIDLIKPAITNPNKYLAFTEGDHGLARFDTSAENGRSIMVIKESYGNAMVPYLAAHYEQVYVFDPRKAEIDFNSFVSSNGIDDILVVNYSIAIGNQGWKDALMKSLR